MLKLCRRARKLCLSLVHFHEAFAHLLLECHIRIIKRNLLQIPYLRVSCLCNKGALIAVELSISTSPEMSFKSVVLPQPFLPTIAIFSVFLISKFYYYAK